MRRRDVIAGLGSLGVVGGGALWLQRSGSTGEGVEPVTVEQLDGEGNIVGDLQVPQRGSPTLLTVFATWCQICRRSMPEVVTLQESVGDEVEFVSVSNEAVGQTVSTEDVADWWTRHGGDWPVGIDTDFAVTERFDVRAVPTVVITDEENRVVYDDSGAHSAGELRDALP